MAHYRNSRILPTILTIVVIVIAIAGLVALARVLFFSGSAPEDQAQVDTSQQQLLDTNEGNAVRMTVRGPIVANENFRSYQITVAPGSRVIQTYTGYLDTVLEQQTLDNNTAAYGQFVFALDRANMVVGTPFEGERNDVRGICATGRVYEFSTLKAGEVVETLWTSTCNGSKGSLRANSTQLSELFVSQIPDGSRLINRLSL